MNNFCNREQLIHQVKSTREWEMIIIGGGASGLGIAVDAASRGYSVLLLEQSDFAKGTSSRSTKLIHGGVRYLEQGNIQLVYDAVRERGILLKNAPHLVKRQSFIIPCKNWYSILKYFLGLKIYDWLAGSYSLDSSKFISREKVLELLPGIKSTGLKGGILYYDAKFDDARLAINLAQTCIEKGGIVLNYFKVTGLNKVDDKVKGVNARDLESGIDYVFEAKVVINATGVFADDIISMDHPDSKPIIKVSQGVHMVLNRSFLNSESALLIPKTKDGRVLFAVPWYQHVLVGTTDTPCTEILLEPVAYEEEIRFILDAVQQYLDHTPENQDVLTVFAGLRPLVSSENNSSRTKDISRDHKLFIHDSNLITITGGKWTTYRKMAEETVDAAIKITGLQPVSCLTRDLHIHGYYKEKIYGHTAVYGSDAERIAALFEENPALKRKLVSTLPYTEAEVIWAARYEMARTVEDVLARRLRMLFIDARAAIKAAPRVASLLAAELHYDQNWERKQLEHFTHLANQYLLPNNYITNELTQLHPGT